MTFYSGVLRIWKKHIISLVETVVFAFCLNGAFLVLKFEQFYLHKDLLMYNIVLRFI